MKDDSDGTYSTFNRHREMSDTTAIVLAVGLTTVAIAVMSWIRSRLVLRAHARTAADLEAFKKRLAAPDLDGLERHLGHPIPASLRALYDDHELIMSFDILIAVPNPLEQDEECYIAWFEPGDAESLRDAWPGCEGLFPIANNGFGDQYLVDPRQPDPEVITYDHETGERRGLGVTLSEFLVAPRRMVPDE
jgi:hypothetical protein